jgi:hypothetical protein
MLAAGVAYDAWLKRGPWGGWRSPSPSRLLPVYAWYGATGEMPPRPELLLPLAALAGPRSSWPTAWSTSNATAGRRHNLAGRARPSSRLAGRHGVLVT